MYMYTVQGDWKAAQNGITLELNKLLKLLNINPWHVVLVQ